MTTTSTRCACKAYSAMLPIAPMTPRQSRIVDEADPFEAELERYREPNEAAVSQTKEGTDA